MLVGVQPMLAGSGLRIEQLAVEAENRGFDSIWLGEHTHIPVGSLQGPPFSDPMRDKAGITTLPEAYLTTWSPLVSLAFAAAATSRISVATGVSLPLQSDPFTVAKSFATLDQLSGGRVILGAGVGWNRLEYENHTSVPWSQRYNALDEFVQVLRALWTQEQASFDGRYYRFDPVFSYPKPQQRPHPPIVMPGVGPVGMKHAAKSADGWLPLLYQVDDIAATVDAFRRMVKDLGREPVDITVGTSNRDGRWITVDELRRLKDLGIHRVILMDDPAKIPPPDERFRLYDTYAPHLAELAS